MSATQDNKPAYRAASGYALTHCMQCAAGWSRTGPEGAMLIVCLLDREPVWDRMTDCSRFQKKDDEQA